VRGRVVQVDNSGIDQFGIVKTGDQRLTLRVLNGPFKGREVTASNRLIGKLELDKMFAEGDTALTVLDLDATGQTIIDATVVDHYRIHVEIILLAAFVVLLIAYAGFTGVKAVLSFAFAAVAIWKLLLPGFLAGYDPVLLSLAIVFLLTGVIVFLVGGIGKKGLVAFLGSTAGIVLTCILSLAFGAGLHIHGAVKPFSETLLYSGYPHLNLTRIFLAGVFLASSGAVMDISMDISSAMTEIRAKKPDIHRGELMRSGFTVGRPVIGTMTTTLLLAYSGGYTAMLMVFMAQGTPLANVLNITYVSAEVLHTLVGSFGLVTVAPLTALIGGVLLVPPGKAEIDTPAA
jgi:uncharacterized membrane protein